MIEPNHQQTFARAAGKQTFFNRFEKYLSWQEVQGFICRYFDTFLETYEKYGGFPDANLRKLSAFLDLPIESGSRELLAYLKAFVHISANPDVTMRKDEKDLAIKVRDVLNTRRDFSAGIYYIGTLYAQGCAALEIKQNRPEAKQNIERAAKNGWWDARYDIAIAQIRGSELYGFANPTKRNTHIEDGMSTIWDLAQHGYPRALTSILAFILDATHPSGVTLPIDRAMDPAARTARDDALRTLVQLLSHPPKEAYSNAVLAPILQGRSSANHTSDVTQILTDLCAVDKRRPYAYRQAIEHLMNLAGLNKPMQEIIWETSCPQSPSEAPPASAMDILAFMR